jgi:hypothetical protein
VGDNPGKLAVQRRSLLSPDYPEVSELTLTGFLIIPESYISVATRWTWPVFRDAG